MILRATTQNASHSLNFILSEQMHAPACYTASNLELEKPKWPLQARVLGQQSSHTAESVPPLVESCLVVDHWTLKMGEIMSFLDSSASTRSGTSRTLNFSPNMFSSLLRSSVAKQLTGLYLYMIGVKLDNPKHAMCYMSV